MRACFVFLAGVVSCSAQIPDQDFGYLDVRQGAHMFWWLYGANETTTAPVPRSETPLIAWFQGGPGAGGSGYGNYAEMGPIDTDLQYRPSTWMTAANLLYIDSPVGAGYSYVDSPDLYPTNNTQVKKNFNSNNGVCCMNFTTSRSLDSVGCC